MNNFPPEHLAELLPLHRIDAEIARKPMHCRGQKSGNSYTSNCLSCARLNPDAQRYIVPTWRAGYVAGSGIPWNECDERLPRLHSQTVDRVTPDVCGQNVASVTRRKRAVFVLGVAVVAVAAALVSVAAHAAPVCPWPDPGADPFQGDQASAVMALEEIPLSERIQLADQVKQGYSGKRVRITRAGVVGANIGQLSDMNFGAGRICRGAVDTSMWTAGHSESATAFSVGRHSVLIVDKCRNVVRGVNLDALPEPAAPTKESLKQSQAPRVLAPEGSGTIFATPEPGTWALAGLALAGVALSRKRK
jgi:hypothetical protein